MGRKRHTPEQIITALREAEVGLARGMAEAKDLFLATLLIGSGILAYWFAARGRSSSGDNDK